MSRATTILLYMLVGAFVGAVALLWLIRLIAPGRA